jgi:hypothetical protein
MRFSSAVKLEYQMEEIAASSRCGSGLWLHIEKEAVKRPYSISNVP